MVIFLLVCKVRIVIMKVTRGRAMICFKCGKEMEFGHISAGGYRVLWSKRKNRMSSWPREGDVVIEKNGIIANNDASNAYCCKDCKTIIVEY